MGSLTSLRFSKPSRVGCSLLGFFDVFYLPMDMVLPEADKTQKLSDGAGEPALEETTNTFLF